MIRQLFGVFIISLLGVPIWGGELKYCIIVDTSASMASRKGPTVEMVGEIVRSGFDKQILNGEKFAIWVYNESNYWGRLPIQKWDAMKPETFVETATKFMEAQPFGKQCRFERVAYDMNRFVAAHRDVLLTLITDGETPVSGIAYDIEINTEMSRRKAELGVKRGPFLISLLALQGKIRSFKIDEGKGPFELPVLPYEPALAVKKNEEESKSASRQVASVEKKKEEAETKPEKKKEDEKPVIFELPPGAKVVATRTDEQPIATPPVATVKPPTLQTIRTQAALVTIVSTTTNQSATNVTASVSTTTPASQKTATETNFVATGKVEKPPGESGKQEKPKSSSAMPSTVLLSRADSTGTTILYYCIAIGGFLTAIAVGLIILQRRLNHRGSIISQSLLRDFKSS